MLEEVVQEKMEVDKEQVQQEEEEGEKETRETELSQQSPPTLQKHDTKVTNTCLSGHTCRGPCFIFSYAELYNLIIPCFELNAVLSSVNNNLLNKVMSS